MATEAARQVLDRRELFKRLIGRRVEMTTTCKSFDRTTGTIKEVFDDFVMFLTQTESAGSVETTRHWVMFEAITVVTEAPKMPTAEEIEIMR